VERELSYAISLLGGFAANSLNRQSGPDHLFLETAEAQ
jgi:hypothetical protein